MLKYFIPSRWYFIFIFAPYINSIKNTFYCSNWFTLP